jgi:hypothetical protein
LSLDRGGLLLPQILLRHHVDEIFAHASLLQGNQALDAGIEIRAGGMDALDDEEFVESGA